MPLVLFFSYVFHMKKDQVSWKMMRFGLFRTLRKHLFRREGFILIDTLAYGGKDDDLLSYFSKRG